MNLTELENLVKESEGQHLEYKETTGQRVEACRTLCAFLNKDGGTVVFGVTRNGKLTGQLMADTTKRDLYDAFQAFEPAADIEVEYVPVDQTHTAIVCRVDHGCVITTFKRPDWTRSDASCQITGTPCQITGARWTITDVNPFARLPKMRKDARENAEAVLHEIIADNGVTLAQICARTGMALRTINNALLTLREAGIINSPVVNRVVNDGANGAKDGANGANDGVSHSDEGSATADSVIRLLRQDSRMSAIRMATALGIGRRTAQRALKSLRLSGKIRRRGGTRGYWEVMA